MQAQHPRVVHVRRIYDLLRLVWRETQVSWAFTRYDVSSTIMPALLFASAAWWQSDTPTLAHAAHVLWQVILYFPFYIYSFTLSNQIAGVAEDQINKPNRPLPQGMVTRRGAWLRLWIVMGVFALVGLLLHVVVLTLVWQAATLLHNQGGGSRHWVTKNSVMVTGVVVQLVVAWQFATPLTTLAVVWIASIAASIFVLINLQDLRDQRGDALVARRTLPLVLGDQRTRWFLGGSFVLVGVGLPWLLGGGRGLFALDVLLGLTSVLCLVVAGRIVWLRNPQADHRSYMLFTYWYCLLLAGAVLA